ncbi:GCN5-related N-acetyltransferase [Kribbella flavida DSM 17836]|uniref:GCN5-related N-acetyltransferase n=1 Tax=Kribbella flavida (strain DSM 17836 / JCM 10339 / NBRC 14399) TaxID=479435 RepID=D2PUW4_KRIFD|nr:GNAT family N-acetyltransferase [Kribbella flavida]ADB31430.1 GCN5-related N-acetyltransferase [Kribbella flavida DSM 17836]
MPMLTQPALAAGTLRELEQPRLTGMRPWHEGDAPAVRRAFAGPEIQRWHVLRIDDDDEALGWIAQWPRRWADEEAASWAVVDEQDRALGQIGLRGIDLAEAKAHLSYWLLPEARGRGLAVRAVGVLTEWCFTTLKLHRLTIDHSTQNEQSCRVATAAGFPVEGVLRGSMLHADGWHDAHIHGRLAVD